MRTRVPVRPAATVMVLRQGVSGVEALLLRRSAKLVFHGGAWVFPGGRVDLEDRATASGEQGAARVAAVREAQEEAGLRLSPGDLVPFAHWTTPEGPPRRFATWFFAALAGPESVRTDGGEIQAHRWESPARALEHFAAGAIDLPPPTFVSLCWLRAYEDVEQALAAARASEPFFFVPHPHRVPGGVVSLYGGDAGYEDGRVEHDGPRHRLWMLSDGWRYERDL